MKPSSVVRLEFGRTSPGLGKGKALADGLSVVVQIGNTLWVANDETISLERLTLAKDRGRRKFSHAHHHERFALGDYLHLPVPPSADAGDVQEADIEGLVYADGYLWLTGSHSLKRAEPGRKADAKKAHKQLAKVSSDGNRYLLARIPVVKSAGTIVLAKEDTQRGKKRTAAQLRGNDRGNDLTDALRADEHLGPFLTIPGKDNGFDIEGLAVAGERIFIGLRGPVLRGWAVILEVQVEAEPRHPSSLKLKPIGPKRRPYRKHLLHLGGRGVRDLCAHGSDLLILAGPTMSLDGPGSIFRWPGGSKPAGESAVPGAELEHLIDVPCGQGADYAEGMTLFAPAGGKSRSLLIVYDTASKRRKRGANAVAADVFALP